MEKTLVAKAIIELEEGCSLFGQWLVEIPLPQVGKAALLDVIKIFWEIDPNPSFPLSPCLPLSGRQGYGRDQTTGKGVGVGEGGC